ncbi:MAG TPA: YbhB/YbcL family Raf kinase inhibitor-like protein [Gemmatimonadaceae bacterium]|nr:YbhB/YbcL family Raf kinase inhibitor-like protein [Gemmatimonadaceae bacterium]
MTVIAPLLRRRAPLALSLAGIVVLAGARADLHATSGAPHMTVTSSAFTADGSIPAEFTCDGPGVSPPLAWSGVPANAKSAALIVDDPDAPDPAHPQMTWVHWVLYNIPPATTLLVKGAAAGALPPGTKEGKNDWKRTGYGGPCPPVGRHRYFFKLYALDVMLPDLKGPTKSELETAMHGHIIAQGELIGTYARSK